MKPFDEVSRATQRQRLRHLGEVALLNYGIDQARLRFMSDTASVVFRVDTPAGRLALRIDPEPPSAQWLTWLQGEMCWLLALRRDTSLAVPEPVTALDGTWVQTVSTAGVPDGRLVTMLHWQPGRSIGPRPSPAMMAQLGTFMAQLHQHSAHFTFPDGITRARTQWDKLVYFQDHHNDTTKTLTPPQRDLCAAAVGRLLAEIAEIGTAHHYGLIHADLTPENCLWHQGKLQVIDFADSRFASHFYDMAVPLADLERLANFQRLRAAFFEGYSRLQPLPAHCESAVQTFMVARAFDIVEWIHLDWPHPAHYPFGPALLAGALTRIQHYMA